ncbi:MAG: hypothetical protein JJU33_02970 [Phycisphaerales bacterium]|nr:hypothetical protein [Phycisphaerales bacterium]
MDYIRAGVVGVIVGLLGAGVWAFVAWQFDLRATIIAIGIGGAVGHSMGFISCRYADLGIGAMAMLIAMGSIAIGNVAAVELYIQDTSLRGEAAEEYAFFTFADNEAFWALTRGETLDWPEGHNYMNAYSTDHLPQDLVRKCAERWNDMTQAELRELVRLAPVHDAWMIAARAEEIAESWRAQGHRIEPAIASKDDEEAMIWDTVPAEAWQAAIDEWHSLDDERKLARKDRHLREARRSIRNAQSEFRDEVFEQGFDGFDYLCFAFASIWAFGAGMGLIGNDD